MNGLHKYGNDRICLPLEELPSPSSDKILEPLRVNRVLRQSLPASEVEMGSDAGLSDAAESIGDG